MTVVPVGLFASIVNYCEFEETVGCVEALLETGLPPDRIVIVDNASPDGSGDRLEDRFPACRVLRAPSNLGYGPGHNCAIKTLLEERGGELGCVFIANPDMRVQAGALEELERVIAEEEDVAGVSAVQWRSAEREELDETFEGWFRGNGGDPARLGESPFLSTSTLQGAAMALSAEALRAVGGFDPLYFLYAEEADLARRFRHHGYRTGVATRSHVVHRRPYRVDDEPERDDDVGGLPRDFQRRSSKYLYHLKDPTSPLAANALRVAGVAGKHLLESLVSEHRSPRGWAREVTWFLRRARRGVAHRRREKRGSAHLRSD